MMDIAGSVLLSGDALLRNRGNIQKEGATKDSYEPEFNQNQLSVQRRHERRSFFSN